MVICASCATVVCNNPPTDEKADASSTTPLSVPLRSEFTCSSHAPGAVWIAAPDTPTLAVLIAADTAARLRSPVETTATLESPRRSPDDNCIVRSPAPADTITLWPGPADVTAVGGFVPILISPSTPTDEDAASDSAPSAEPPVTASDALEPSWVVVIPIRPLPPRATFAPSPPALIAVCTAVTRPVEVYVPPAMVTVRATPSMVRSSVLFVPSISVDAPSAAVPAAVAPAVAFVTETVRSPRGTPVPTWIAPIPRRVAVDETASDASDVTTAALDETVEAVRKPAAWASRSTVNVSEP